MIDTHCHLTDPRLLAKLPQVLAEAQAAGVKSLISIGTSHADSRNVCAVARSNRSVRCVVGVHPGTVGSDAMQMPDPIALAELASDPSCVAVGEIGLDFHYPLNSAGRDRQYQAFRTQLSLADRLSKPVVIHCRDAVDETLAVLGEWPGLRAVFHCFTGTLDEARRIIAGGYWIGFTGAVTYKANQPLRDAAGLVPANRYLVETDAPYLSPEPVRKIRPCRPAFVMHTAAVVAAARGLDLAEVDRQTTQNAITLFGSLG